MYNATYENIILNDISQDSPVGLKLRFTLPLTPIEQGDIERVMLYWLRSTAITANTTPIIMFWEGCDTCVVYAMFHTGGFNGDLTHYSAAMLGMGKFKIGLCTLFTKGYTATTLTGLGCKPVRDVIVPNSITFLYTLHPPVESIHRVTWENYENAKDMHVQLLIAGILD